MEYAAHNTPTGWPEIHIVASTDSARLVSIEDSIPIELRFFQQHKVIENIVRDHTVIVGAGGARAFGGRPPGCRVILLTRKKVRPHNVSRGPLLANSIEAAMDVCHREGETRVYVLGGARMFDLFMPLAVAVHVLATPHAIDYRLAQVSAHLAHHPLPPASGPLVTRAPPEYGPTRTSAIDGPRFSLVTTRHGRPVKDSCYLARANAADVALHERAFTLSLGAAQTPQQQHVASCAHDFQIVRRATPPDDSPNFSASDYIPDGYDEEVALREALVATRPLPSDYDEDAQLAQALVASWHEVTLTSHAKCTASQVDDDPRFLDLADLAYASSCDSDELLSDSDVPPDDRWDSDDYEHDDGSNNHIADCLAHDGGREGRKNADTYLGRCPVAALGWHAGVLLAYLDAQQLQSLGRVSLCARRAVCDYAFDSCTAPHAIDALVADSIRCQAARDAMALGALYHLTRIVPRVTKFVDRLAVDVERVRLQSGPWWVGAQLPTRCIERAYVWAAALGCRTAMNQLAAEATRARGLCKLYNGERDAYACIAPTFIEALDNWMVDALGINSLCDASDSKTNPLRRLLAIYVASDVLLPAISLAGAAGRCRSALLLQAASELATQNAARWVDLADKDRSLPHRITSRGGGRARDIGTLLADAALKGCLMPVCSGVWDPPLPKANSKTKKDDDDDTQLTFFGHIVAYIESTIGDNIAPDRADTAAATGTHSAIPVPFGLNSVGLCTSLIDLVRLLQDGTVDRLQMRAARLLAVLLRAYVYDGHDTEPAVQDLASQQWVLLMRKLVSSPPLPCEITRVLFGGASNEPLPDGAVSCGRRDRQTKLTLSDAFDDGLSLLYDTEPDLYYAIAHYLTGTNLLALSRASRSDCGRVCGALMINRGEFDALRADHLQLHNKPYAILGSEVSDLCASIAPSIELRDTLDAITYTALILLHIPALKLMSSALDAFGRRANDSTVNAILSMPNPMRAFVDTTARAALIGCSPVITCCIELAAGFEARAAAILSNTVWHRITTTKVVSDWLEVQLKTGQRIAYAPSGDIANRSWLPAVELAYAAGQHSCPLLLYIAAAVGVRNSPVIMMRMRLRRAMNSTGPPVKTTGLSPAAQRPLFLARALLRGIRKGSCAARSVGLENVRAMLDSIERLFFAPESELGGTAPTAHYGLAFAAAANADSPIRGRFCAARVALLNAAFIHWPTSAVSNWYERIDRLASQI